jgi:Ca-activated chloride channel family protein
MKRAALLALLSLAGVVAVAASNSARAASWSDMWLTRDQQAQRLLDSNQPAAAAPLFSDARRQAYAQLRAGQYAKAADLLAPFKDADSLYNRGNALAHTGKLREALKAYDQALAASPGNQDVIRNRDLVKRALDQQKRMAQAQQGNGGKSGNQGARNGSGNGQGGGQGGGSRGNQGGQASGNQNGPNTGSASPNAQSQPNAQSPAQARNPSGPNGQSGTQPQTGGAQSPAGAQQQGNSSQQGAPQPDNASQPGGQQPSGSQAQGANAQPGATANMAQQRGGQSTNDALAQSPSDTAQSGNGTTTGQASVNSETASQDAAAALRYQQSQQARNAANNDNDKNAAQTRLAADAREGAHAAETNKPPQQPPSEQALALDQWLRGIPEDSGELLRRKFLIEHMMRQQGDAQ